MTEAERLTRADFQTLVKFLRCCDPDETAVAMLAALTAVIEGTGDEGRAAFHAHVETLRRRSAAADERTRELRPR
jgi:hypothetical protein